MPREIALGLLIAALAWGVALFDAIATLRAGRETSRWEVAPSWEGAVEVRGAVGRPGVVAGLAGVPAGEALASADPRVRPRGPGLGLPLEEGDRITLQPDGHITRGRMSGRELLTLGLAIPLAGASAEDLEALPGVGPVTAGRIVSFRDARGGVTKIEDLGGVPGIGPKKIDRIRPHLETAR